MEYLFESPIVRSPIEEFQNFCQTRLEGLSMTSNKETLDAYREAVRRVEQALKEEEA